MSVTMQKEDCLNIDDEDWENIFKLDEPIFSDLVTSFDVKPLLTEDDINLGFEQIVSELTENVNLDTIDFDPNTTSLNEALPEKYINDSLKATLDGDETNQLSCMISIPPVSILHYIDDAVQIDCINEICEKNERLPCDDKLYDCTECEYTSGSWHNYMDHLYNHEYSNMFVCKICKKRYHGKRSLNLHVLVHIINKKMGFKKRSKRKSRGKKIHECPKCKYKTRFKNNLTRHISIHDNVRPYECEVCNKQFKSMAQLKIHTYTHSEVKRFCCPDCDYQTNRKCHLKRHCQEKHFVENPFKFLQWTYDTSASTNADEHVTIHCVDVDKEFKCSHCPYQTDHRNRLNRHLTVHYNIKPFTCDECDESFKRKEQLQRHKVRRHIEEKKYECWGCSYKTNVKEHIKRHLLTHNAVLPYECGVCHKRFKLSQSLKSHSYTHITKKEFQCMQCHYKSDKKKNFMAHLKSQHPGMNESEALFTDGFFKTSDGSDPKLQVKKYLVGVDKKFKCSLCHYQTDYKSHLTRHMFVHDNTKPFECTVCHQRFVQKVQLLSHVGSKHIDEKVHKCSLCCYETNNKYHFKQHLATHDRRQLDPQKMANDWENWTTGQAKELQNYMSVVDVK